MGSVLSLKNLLRMDDLGIQVLRKRGEWMIGATFGWQVGWAAKGGKGTYRNR